MKASLVRCIAILALACKAAGAAPTEAARVLNCMRANVPLNVRAQTIELTAFDREGGARMTRGSVYAVGRNGSANLMARVEYPRDLAGAAYLVREAGPAAELFLYLPETKRIKRVAAGGGAGKLWGSDFSYDEFRLVLGAFGEGELALVGSEQIEGRPADVLALTPGPGSGYDAAAIVVDRQTCVILKAEFRSRDRVRKRLDAPPAGLRRTGAYWHASEMTLSDLRQQTRTRLRIDGLAADHKRSARYFHPQHFHEAR